MTAVAIKPCLWFDGEAEEAANFYVSLFPDSRIDSINRAPGDYPAGKSGAVVTVEFTLLGSPFVALNGGPGIAFNESVSFQVFTDDQDETDSYWQAILESGGEEIACSWCKDKYGLRWQIVPRRLIELINGADTAKAKRAFDAMMGMTKIDIAALDEAVAAVD